MTEIACYDTLLRKTLLSLLFERNVCLRRENFSRKVRVTHVIVFIKRAKGILLFVNLGGTAVVLIISVLKN